MKNQAILAILIISILISGCPGSIDNIVQEDLGYGYYFHEVTNIPTISNVNTKKGIPGVVVSYNNNNSFLIALEKDLLSDEKELAEHLMLVDLARNDLGRTARSGTVSPRALNTVERYSHVMHIVSEIEAQIDKKYDVYDLIKTTFPAGTVSGAPKIMAMGLVSKVEKTKRGPYAGLVGHFDINGDFDSCITIRSLVHKDGAFYIQVGAGIVYDSVPEKEFDETMSKAGAMIKSLGISVDS